MTPSLYVTQSGDLFGRVAGRVGFSAEEILSLNPTLDPARLKVGYGFFVPVRDSTEQFSSWVPTQELVCGPKGFKRIALTFDAGGDGKYAGDLSDLLERQGIRCSFFITGKFAEVYPDAVRIISASGHRVHNHSYSHPDFTTISEAAMVEQVQKAESILSELTGQPIKPWFRFPFGARNAQTARIVASLGYRSIYWTLDSLDSVGEEKTSEAIVSRIVTAGGMKDSDSFLDGAIVLLHLGNPRTVQAVGEIIENLRGRGFEFVTVDDLIAYRP
ncbi:MAG TPA: polysaccharide deacetylase family protein [bacterium]|nr:polysaccharide deacetylase family protein [bacterium]